MSLTIGALKTHEKAKVSSPSSRRDHGFACADEVVVDGATLGRAAIGCVRIRATMRWRGRKTRRANPGAAPTLTATRRGMRACVSVGFVSASRCRQPLSLHPRTTLSVAPPPSPASRDEQPLMRHTRCASRPSRATTRVLLRTSYPHTPTPHHNSPPPTPDSP